ncbi:CO(2)-response secreted protease-like [Humulus lupulus]|uniref:CO(2)-response secreted protease-like n=1 Tax=Humulus lupulus TaxID=3486 RepID=UPI002B40F12F|nr:CO(2)-response secreted protease-like [Humulus lupulus]
MKSILLIPVLFTLVVTFVFSLLLGETKAAQAGGSNNNGLYIVYMGASPSTDGSLRDDHAKLINSLFRRKANALVHTYKHGFSGFAARLSEAEAQSVAQKPGVVSVFRDPILKLHTTHSWDFLKYQTALKIDSFPKENSSSFSSSASSNGGDTIIGILDTGIWPESNSFSDEGMTPIPTGRWKGKCMAGHNFNSSNCNKKLIGARFYDEEDDDMPEEYQTARDLVGHGTHVASTAAGTTVTGASYYGLATGTAKGGSPGSRIAVYRVCTPGCLGSSILKAYDDAIEDGVDVLSLSLGASAAFQPDLYSDPIAIGAFHAVEKGITVVCSAGNDGPEPSTVTNAVPWILTVAATTIDRDFESNVLLGGNKVIKGGGINFSALKKTAEYPLIYAKSAKKSDGDDDRASNCQEESLDGIAIKGNIVVCEKKDGYSTYDKIDTVKSLGGIGVVIIDDESRAVADNYKAFPATVISSKDATNILSYINSTKNPVATILPTETVTEYKPAPAVAYFSSRGPSYITSNMIKPDIAAPGVNILAAWIANDTDDTPAGKDPSLFNVISGTSMSCPHVSGVAATVKSQHPEWSPSAIKSAIMTTAIQTNNLKAPMTTNSGSVATPFDYGAGEVTTEGPLQPGLVYETTIVDYLNFLCYYGYNESKIKLISKTIPNEFACPKDSSSDKISNINYPSIAISNFNGSASKTISRVVKYVGDGEAIFTAATEAPSGLNVTVKPEELRFKGYNQTLTYQVTFTFHGVMEKNSMGVISWTNEMYNVRTPFVLLPGN